jgi:hypothetical protein
MGTALALNVAKTINGSFGKTNQGSASCTTEECHQYLHWDLSIFGLEKLQIKPNDVLAQILSQKGRYSNLILRMKIHLHARRMKEFHQKGNQLLQRQLTIPIILQREMKKNRNIVLNLRKEMKGLPILLQQGKTGRNLRIHQEMKSVLPILLLQEMSALKSGQVIPLLHAQSVQKSDQVTVLHKEVNLHAAMTDRVIHLHSEMTHLQEAILPQAVITLLQGAQAALAALAQEVNQIKIWCISFNTGMHLF